MKAPPTAALLRLKQFGERKAKAASLHVKTFSDQLAKKQDAEVSSLELGHVDAVKLELFATGDYQTATLSASGFPAGKGVFHWHRAGTGGQFTPIAETLTPQFHPSIDDVGARICCQWHSTEGGMPSTFAELGPILLDPAVRQEAAEAYPEADRPFLMTARSQDDKKLTLEISAQQLRITKEGDTSEYAFVITSESVIELAETAVGAGSGPTLYFSRPRKKKKNKLKRLATIICEGQRSRDVLGLVLRRLAQEAKSTEGDLFDSEEDSNMAFSSHGHREEEAAAPAAAEEVETETEEIVFEAGEREFDSEREGTETGSTAEQLESAEGRKSEINGDNNGAVTATDADLMQTIASLRADRDSKSRALRRFTDEHARITQANDEMGERERLLLTRVEDLLQERAPLSQRAQLLEKEKKSLQRDMLSLRDTLQSLSEQVATSKDGEVRMAQMLETEREDKAQLRELIESQQRTNDKAQERIIRLKAKLQKSKKSTKGTELEDLQNKLQVVQAQLGEQTKEGSLSHKDVMALTENVRQQEGELERVQRVLQLAQADVTDWKRRTTAARDDTARAEAALAALQEHQQATLQTHKQAMDRLRTEHAEALQQEAASLKATGQGERVQEQGREKAKAQEIDADEETVYEVRKELLAAVAAQKAETDTMVAERNFFRRKANSLARQCEKLLGAQASAARHKGESRRRPASNGIGSSNTSSNNRSSGRVVDAQAAKHIKALQQHARSLKGKLETALKALDAYRKAFEQQLMRTKHEREANLLLVNSSALQGEGQRLVALRKLANTLSEAVCDKEVELEQVRKANKTLGRRVRSLEQTQATTAADAAASTTKQDLKQGSPHKPHSKQDGTRDPKHKQDFKQDKQDSERDSKHKQDAKQDATKQETKQETNQETNQETKQETKHKQESKQDSKHKQNSKQDSKREGGDLQADHHHGPLDTVASVGVVNTSKQQDCKQDAGDLLLHEDHNGPSDVALPPKTMPQPQPPQNLEIKPQLQAQRQPTRSTRTTTSATNTTTTTTPHKQEEDEDEDAEEAEKEQAEEEEEEAEEAEEEEEEEEEDAEEDVQEAQEDENDDNDDNDENEEQAEAEAEEEEEEEAGE